MNRWSFIILLFCSLKSFAQAPNLKWKSRFDGTSYFEDRGTLVMFDQQGNLLVAGYEENGCSDYDICLTKYNPSGDTLWHVSYDGSGTYGQEDYPASIQIDNAGNIYLTGRTESNSFFYAVTLKYAPNGTLTWAKKYTSAESEGNDIVVDASGNIIMCGFKITSFNKDYLVIKYDAAGNQLWTQSYTNGNYDEAIALGCDIAGNVYVTGRRSGVNAFYDWATLKYDASGVQQWVDVYANSIAGYNEEPVDLELDPSGNIYVAGYIQQPSGSDRNYYVIKYNPTGGRIWESQFANTTPNGDDYPVDMAVDAGGNVFVLGNSLNNPGGMDICTVKFNATGQLVWETRIDSIGQTDYARSIVLNPAGNSLYIAGDITVSNQGSGLMRDWIIVKYDTAGTELSRLKLDGPANDFDLPYDLAVSSTGDVAATGMFSVHRSGYQNGDIATYKMDSQLNTLWNRSVNGNGFADDHGTAMVVDSLGNTYICGFTKGGDNTLEDLIVLKYDAVGNKIWSYLYQGPEENSSEKAMAIAVDQQQHVYITGTVDTSGGSAYRDIFTVELDANGHPVWQDLRGGSAGGNDAPSSIVVDNGGNVFVAATTVNTATGFDGSLIGFDTNGGLLFQTNFDKAGISESFSGMLMDSQHNFYAAGSYTASSGALSEGLLVKFNPAGSVLWDTIYDYSASTGDRDFFTSIASDANDNVFVCGQSNNNFVAAKYDPSGNPLWVQNYSYSNFVDSATVIKVDPYGNVYVGGVFGQTIEADFGVVKYRNDGTLVWDRKYSNSPGSDDILKDMVVDSAGAVYLAGWETANYSTNYNFMVVSYDSSGVFKYELIYTDSLGVEPDFGKCIGMDHSGNLYVMGDGNENCFGNININGFRYDIQIIKYGYQSSVGIADINMNSGLVVYPNPANEVLNIRLNTHSTNSDNTPFYIYDSTGRVVYHGLCDQSGEVSIDISGWNAGIYNCHVALDGAFRNVKFVIAGSR